MAPNALQEAATNLGVSEAFRACIFPEMQEHTFDEKSILNITDVSFELRKTWI